MGQVECPNFVLTHGNQTAATVRVLADKHHLSASNGVVLGHQLQGTVHAEPSISGVVLHRHLVAAGKVRLAAGATDEEGHLPGDVPGGEDLHLLGGQLVEEILKEEEKLVKDQPKTKASSSYTGKIAVILIASVYHHRHLPGIALEKEIADQKAGEYGQVVQKGQVGLQGRGE